MRTAVYAAVRNFWKQESAELFFEAAHEKLFLIPAVKRRRKKIGWDKGAIGAVQRGMQRLELENGRRQASVGKEFRL